MTLPRSSPDSTHRLTSAHINSYAPAGTFNPRVVGSSPTGPTPEKAGPGRIIPASLFFFFDRVGQTWGKHHGSTPRRAETNRIHA
jgi:hypothetical protein